MAKVSAIATMPFCDRQVLVLVQLPYADRAEKYKALLPWNIKLATG